MIRYVARSVVASGLLYCSLLAPHASAVGVPPQINAELPQARLAGAGNFRYYGLHIYDAQFWVGARGYRPAAMCAEKFALDLRYARFLVGRKIAESSAKEMEKLGLGSEQQRRSWQMRMEQLFPDVQEGTHITGVYVPNHGARFYVNGKLLGDIADPEFGCAFFAIWLDPKTTARSLRDALLAGAAPP
ncbi:MAG: chalcone isomerase family protein [Burkholderiaceae bacterium]